MSFEQTCCLFNVSQEWILTTTTLSRIPNCFKLKFKFIVFRAQKQKYSPRGPYKLHSCDILCCDNLKLGQEKLTFILRKKKETWRIATDVWSLSLWWIVKTFTSVIYAIYRNKSRGRGAASGVIIQKSGRPILRFLIDHTQDQQN